MRILFGSGRVARGRVVRPRRRPCPSHHTEQYGEGMSTDPLVKTGRALSMAETTRYARHVLLPDVGRDGQERLGAARVLVVGAGGLGSPALLYLAAAGVGTIGIVDDDRVEVSNLQRQVIHGGSDVGRSKVDSARDAIAEVNPHVTVRLHEQRLDAGNVLDVLAG